jgi:hypothetical protein
MFPKESRGSQLRKSYHRRTSGGNTIVAVERGLGKNVKGLIYRFRERAGSIDPV